MGIVTGMCALRPASVLEDAVAAATVVSPSFSAAVFDRGGVLATASKGSTTPGGTPPTPDSVYRIASMSKSFCVAAVLRLADAGLVRLDEPISTYVPQFRAPRDAAGREWPVSVRMLMTNSSGMPEDNAWADSQIGIGREDLLALFERGVRFGDLPGASYQYSNLGFSLLGLLVENVSGTSYPRYLTDEILTPLGLTHTRFRPDDYEPGTDVVPGFSTFDRGATWLRRPFVGDGALASIGGLFSTVGDIARWAGFLSAACLPSPHVLTAGGTLAARPDAGDAVVSVQGRRRMQTPATAIHSDTRLDGLGLVAGGYGMGLVVEIDRELGTFAQHSGGLPGFSSHMRWHTDSGLGVVAFANADGASLSGWCREVLAAVLRAGNTPARRMPVWPQTLDAARDLDRMLRHGADFAACSARYTPNVADDIPLAVRRERALLCFAELGGVVVEPAPIEERLLFAEAGSILAWRLPCGGGDAVVRIELNPVADTLVQRIQVEGIQVEGIQAEGTPLSDLASDAVRRYRPLIPEGSTGDA